MYRLASFSRDRCRRPGARSVRIQALCTVGREGRYARAGVQAYIRTGGRHRLRGSVEYGRERGLDLDYGYAVDSGERRDQGVLACTLTRQGRSFSCSSLETGVLTRCAEWNALHAEPLPLGCARGLG
jgi:hypothetical protein